MILREERIGGQRLLLADSLSVMPLLVGFDVVVTDPPYGINYMHGAEKSRFASKHNERPIHGDTKPFDPAIWLRWPSLFWGANHFASRLPGGGRWLVWDKRVGTGFNDQSDVEIAWISGVRAADRIFQHRWNGWIKASEKGEPRVHPTQKPVVVMQWCLGFLPENNVVLDPYLGSGTTLVACQKMGRRGVGIEIDLEFFEAACRRVDEATRVADMFVTDVPRPAAATQESLL